MTLILLIVFLMTPVTYIKETQAVTITELNLKNSVTKEEYLPMCIPDVLGALVFQINIGERFQQTKNDLKYFRNGIGKYGSPGETSMTAKYRQCPKRQGCDTIGEYVSLGELTTLTGSAASSRIELILISKQIEAKLESVYLHMSMLTAKIHFTDDSRKSRRPTLSFSNDGKEPYQWNWGTKDSISATEDEFIDGDSMFYYKINQDIMPFRFLQSATITEQAVTFSTNMTNLETELEELQGKMQQTLNLYKELVELFDPANRGFYPNKLIPFKNWLPKFVNWTMENVNEIILAEEKQLNRFYYIILEYYRYFYIVRRTTCPPGGQGNTYNLGTSDCVIQLGFRLPLLKFMTIYRRFELKAYPVYDGSTWRKISVPLTSHSLRHNWKNLQTTVYAKMNDVHLQTSSTTPMPLVEPNQEEERIPKLKTSNINNQYYYYPPAVANEENLFCYEVQEDLPCQLCNGRAALAKIENTTQSMNCMLSIINFVEQANTTEISMPPCTTIEIEQSKSLTVIEGKADTKTILTGNEDVTLLINCPNKPEFSRKLPKSVSISVDNTDCLLKFLNLNNLDETSPLLKFVSLTDEQKRQYIQTFKELIDHNARHFTQHFNEYGYIYLLTTFSLILLFLLILIMRFIYIQFVYLAQRRRVRSQSPTERERERQAVIYHQHLHSELPSEPATVPNPPPAPKTPPFLRRHMAV